MTDWRRIQSCINAATFGIYSSFALGPFMTAYEALLWIMTPVLVPQIIWEGVRSYRRWRRRRILAATGQPPTLEAVLALIAGARSSVELLSDALNPVLEGPLKQAQARGVEVRLLLGKQGLQGLRGAGSPLAASLWVPLPDEEVRQLIVDRSQIAWGSLLSDNDGAFGPSGGGVSALGAHRVISKRTFSKRFYYGGLLERIDKERPPGLRPWVTS